MAEPWGSLHNSYKSALDGGRALKKLMREDEKVVRDLMSKLSSYVQTASQGDIAIILSSGMQVADKIGPPEELETPGDLHCLHTDKSGEAPMRWRPVRKTRTYFLEMSQSPDDPSSWKPIGSCTTASFTATGLLPGESYWFRVAASGPLGVSAWSDAAKRMTA